MYHSRWKGSHYQAGLQYGNMFKKNNINPFKNFILKEKPLKFTEKCIPLYQSFYPEILEEIQGIAEGLKVEQKIVTVFLFSMFCFLLENRCSCFAFCRDDKIILAKNSDFLTTIEKVCDSPYYHLNKGYSFIGNTTAWSEIEDGVNEHGLAVALTFIYPTKIAAGLNAGMLVRYLLEKCQTTSQAIQALQKLPIASAQTITLADKNGDIAIVECNCDKVIVRKPENGFLFTTNHFVSPEMATYQYQGEDDCYSHQRYQTMLSAFENHTLSFSFTMDLLSGKKGFLCQYDRKKGMDTIWSCIYDLTERKIYRAEGNPSRKHFKEDIRLHF